MKDLHLHLSAGSSKRTVWEVIKSSGYKTGIKNYEEFSKFTSLVDKRNLQNYLDILHWIDKAQSSPSGLQACVYDAFVSSAVVGCSYLELRMNIVKRSQDGSVDLDSLLISGRAGMEMAKNRFGIEGGLILCMGTDCSPEANAAIWQKAKQYFGKGVMGIDIAGPYFIPKYTDKESYTQFIEDSHNQHNFVDIYKEANDLGMVTTVHSGEVNHCAVEEELTFVLSKLKPKRIGHGVQVHRFPHLVELAKDVHFEVCISSNLSTGSIKSNEEFAKVFQFFDDNKLEYSINTDATFLLNTDISKENDLHNQIKSIKL